MKPKVGNRSIKTIWMLALVAAFVICCTSHAIAQTTNQPPALTAQPALARLGCAHALERLGERLATV